jgi:hypothetical protein
MAENRVTLGQLTEILGERAKHHHERNLVLVALPLETAHRIAEQLAQRLGAEYIDFDCQLLARMAEDGWDDHVALERRGTLSVGQMLARRWLGDVADLMNRERPLVIGNLNLAIRYDLDVAGALYDGARALHHCRRRPPRATNAADSRAFAPDRRWFPGLRGDVGNRGHSSRVAEYASGAVAVTDHGDADD